MKKHEMSGQCRKKFSDENCIQKPWFRNPKLTDLEEPGVDERLMFILVLMLKIQDAILFTAFF
jgi:hypothetical protein